MIVLRKNPAANRNRHPVDRFFNELLNDDFFNFGNAGFTPQTVSGTNVYEADGNLVFETELPGLTRDNVKVKVEDGTLFISGDIQKDENIKNEQYLSMGRRYGTFERRFALPEGIEVDNPKKINATLENGILKVSLPLKQSLQPQTFEIEVK